MRFEKKLLSPHWLSFVLALAVRFLHLHGEDFVLRGLSPVEVRCVVQPTDEGPDGLDDPGRPRLTDGLAPVADGAVAPADEPVFKVASTKRDIRAFLYMTTGFLSIVAAAVLWLGGGAAITVLAWQAQRTKDNAQLLQIGKQAEWLSMRLFVPSALVVVAMGVVLMHKGDWGYGHFWTLFGLIAWGVSFVVGAAFLGPESGRLAKLIETKGPEDPEVLARLNRIISVARADVFLILLIAIIDRWT